MRAPSRASLLYPAITLAVVAAVVAVVLAGAHGTTIPRAPAPPLLTVRGATLGRPIAPGFVGLSLGGTRPNQHPVALARSLTSALAAEAIVGNDSASHSVRSCRDLSRDVATAHAHGLPLRVGELSSVSCGGARGAGGTFASALWTLRTLLELARVGVDGVNVNSSPGASFQLFVLSHAGGSWRAAVRPEYYGLLMFAQAAPPGSSLLRLSLSNGGTRLHAWATRAPDGQLRVVLLNDARAGARTVGVRLPGVAGVGRLERLRAPSLGARSGVTLGDQSLGAATATGRLPGPVRIGSARPAAGRYLVRVPAASAVMLTVGR